MIYWPVVPLSEKQLKDVKPGDVLENGLYRKCNIYKGGGGYDQFCGIYKDLFGVELNPVQFVVQLYGCPLRCPYCYVTEDGIFNNPTYISTKELLKSYENSGLEVFHLMGGAPAIYLSAWPELQDKVKVFHSDFLLIERKYPKAVLKKLKGLHAVSFKERYLYTDNQIELLWKNLESLITYGVHFYITFTGKDEFSEEIIDRFGPEVLKNSFTIPIIEYEALK